MRLHKCRPWENSAIEHGQSTLLAGTGFRVFLERAQPPPVASSPASTAYYASLLHKFATFDNVLATALSLQEKMEGARRTATQVVQVRRPTRAEATYSVNYPAAPCEAAVDSCSCNLPDLLQGR